MRPFFSIIVPCCEVGPWVRECLDSVLNQAFRDWECIVGVETSSDNTEDIVREYVAKDSRFTMFTATRSGSASASRNSGIDLARGEYIIFLDGDDTIVEGSLQRLHDQNMASPGADLYPCAIVGCNEFNDEENEIYDNFPADAPGGMTGSEATILVSHFKQVQFPMMPLTICRRQFLLDHQLKCVRGLLGEDFEFTPRAYFWAKSVTPLHEPYYRYRRGRPDSRVTSTSAEQWLREAAIRFKSLFAFHSKVHYYPDFPAQLSLAWGRMWTTAFFSEWFAPLRVTSIPRKHRLETLHFLFSEGFQDFFALANTYRSGRIAGKVVYLFVRFPLCRGACELFFLAYYSTWFNRRFRKWYEKWLKPKK